MKDRSIADLAICADPAPLAARHRDRGTFDRLQRSAARGRRRELRQIGKPSAAAISAIRLLAWAKPLSPTVSPSIRAICWLISLFWDCDSASFHAGNTIVFSPAA
jgi:hypothetical protein